MYTDEVLGVEYTVFILTSRIYDVRRKLLSLELDNLAKRILDRRVITLDEMTIDELHGDR